jgi:hypothetical protein
LHSVCPTNPSAPVTRIWRGLVIAPSIFYADFSWPRMPMVIIHALHATLAVLAALRV